MRRNFILIGIFLLQSMFAGVNVISQLGRSWISMERSIKNGDTSSCQ